MKDSSSWFHVAALLRPQGRRGELLADPLTDAPGIFDIGRTFTLLAEQADADASPQTVTLEDIWKPSGRNSGRIVLKLSGCDSISGAEAIAGRTLSLPSQEQPSLNDDTFFVSDLLGCILYNERTRAGEVVDLQFATTPDGRTRLEDVAPFLAVAVIPGAEPVLVPFVKAWLERVDLRERIIVMRLPDGLLDTTPEAEA